jgi:hypothetical protein
MKGRNQTTGGFSAKALSSSQRVWTKFENFQIGKFLQLFGPKKDKITELQNALVQPPSVQFFVVAYQQNPV